MEVCRILDPKLETLLAVYEKNSFTKAAQALQLTQPAVSHHVRQLEDELGIKIFHRGSKGALKVTPEGKIVLQYAKRIQSLYLRMQQELRDQARQMTSIRVGITHTA